MSEVVVIGAWLAGLAAARRLAAGGHEVTVVEARDRVGGRTEGLVLEDGTTVDVRPSDALAIAIRDALPIGVADHVMEIAGQSWRDLQGDKPHPQSVEVDEMREFLDQVTPDDFRAGDDEG